MTLYAKTAAGEEVQSMETPNYVTRTELQAGTYSFDVMGVTGESNIKAAVPQNPYGPGYEFPTLRGARLEIFLRLNFVRRSISSSSTSMTLE